MTAPPRSMDTAHAYWPAMLAASALGTNAGDLWAGPLLHGRPSSLGVMLALCAAAVWHDRARGTRTEAGYWAAVVAMRAAATNLADLLMETGFGHGSAAILLWGVTVAAACLTRPGSGRGGSPLVDGRYWAAMFAAGLFGTVTGDLLQHVLGIYTASTVLCLTLAGLILARGAASRPIVLYWAIVMAERCAGTAVGDALASHQAVNLGLPLACVCTGGATLLLLWMRGHAQSGKPRGMGAA